MDSKKRSKTSKATTAASAVRELSLRQVVFLLANICQAEHPTFRKIGWQELGAAGADIKKAIRDQNIDLQEPELSVDIRVVQFEKESAAIVDLSYGGGGAAPDPFRFVYIVWNGAYIGNAGDVAS